MEFIFKGKYNISHQARKQQQQPPSLNTHTQGEIHWSKWNKG